MEQKRYYYRLPLSTTLGKEFRSLHRECDRADKAADKFCAKGIITFETFKKGFTTAGMSQDDLIKLARKNGASEEQIKNLHHKLTYKYVEGGVILSDTDFTIK